MPPLKLAIVGAGPSACYVASRLLSLLPQSSPYGSSLKIHMYDRLWAPYGLVRYGVAPDHPEVKVRALSFSLTRAFFAGSPGDRTARTNLTTQRRILASASSGTSTLATPRPTPTRFPSRSTRSSRTTPTSSSRPAAPCPSCTQRCPPRRTASPHFRLCIGIPSTPRGRPRLRPWNASST